MLRLPLQEIKVMINLNISLQHHRKYLDHDAI